MIPFIRSGEIGNNITELSITEEGLCNSSAKFVMKGDILLALYGATSGEISISQINGVINQAILCIKTTLNPYYFKVIWESQKEYILSTYLQGRQGNLSANIIKNISFPIPNKDIQNIVANIYKRMGDKLSIENAILNLLQKQKQYLLQQMFI